MLKFVAAERHHARRMARVGLRPQDAAECAAMGFDEREGLIQSLESSCRAWTGIGDKGQPVVMFGVAQHPKFPDVGIPWLLATPALSARDLLREGPRFITRMHEKFAKLLNMVHARNERACRWLKWAGFRLGTPLPHGPNQELFIPFFRSK